MKFIERWVRRLIAQEIATINSSLQSERVAMLVLIEVLNDQRQAHAAVVMPHVAHQRESRTA